MRIPRQLLREKLVVEPFLGASAYGPKYGAAATIKARVDGRRRTVRTATGTDVIASATATVRPESLPRVPVQSRVTWQRNGMQFEILDILPGEGLSRPAFYELVMS